MAHAKELFKLSTAHRAELFIAHPAQTIIKLRQERPCAHVAAHPSLGHRPRSIITNHGAGPKARTIARFAIGRAVSPWNDWDRDSWGAAPGWNLPGRWPLCYGGELT